jgi:glycosyltransferase involved in cell wall biosynthesis
MTDVSVILATRNRADLLEQTLRHFTAQQLGALSWQVIVADNGSTDRTPEVLREAAERLPLEWVTEPAAGKNRALNRALPLARGRFLVFTDDDVVPEPEWIAELVAAADRWPHHRIFGGRIVPIFPTETPEWLERHWFVGAAYAKYDLAQDEGPTKKLPFGPNFMVRASAMDGVRYHEEIGPSGEDYISGSETELLLRLTRRGEKVVYVPGATVGHVVRPDQLGVEWLFGRSYRLGRCLVELGLVQQKPARRLAGVPLPVWARLGKEWLFSLSGVVGGPRRRFVTGLDYHFIRGCIRQHRLIAGRGRRPPPAVG